MFILCFFCQSNIIFLTKNVCTFILIYLYTFILDWSLHVPESLPLIGVQLRYCDSPWLPPPICGIFLVHTLPKAIIHVYPHLMISLTKNVCTFILKFLFIQLSLGDQLRILSCVILLGFPGHFIIFFLFTPCQKLIHIYPHLCSLCKHLRLSASLIYMCIRNYYNCLNQRCNAIVVT